MFDTQGTDELVPPDEADESTWADDALEAEAVEAACAFEDRLAEVAFCEMDADATLERIAAARSAERRVLAEQLRTAAHWADLHAVLTSPTRVPGGERLLQVGGEGTPQIAEFCVAELALVMQTTDIAAGALVADALDLRHRFPHLWSRVLVGQVEVWRARQVAARTRRLSAAAAARVDTAVADTVGRITGRRLTHLVSKAILEADPPKALSDAEAAAAEAGVHYRRDEVEHGYGTMFIRAAAGDLDALNEALDVISAAMKIQGDPRSADQRRAAAVGIIADPDAAKALVEAAEATRTAPSGAEGADRAGERIDRRSLCFSRAELYVHLHHDTIRDVLDGVPNAGAVVARVEDIGPVIADQIRRWLQHANVTVKPVIDPDHEPPVDCYEVPERIREAIRLRHPADYSPFATSTSRHQDHDHITSYVPMDKGGPPGQTGPATMATLTRRHHRVKTHANGWTVTQIHPGAWLWRTPHGHHALVDHHGTHALGKLRAGA